MKTCTKCGIEKSLSEFHKTKATKDGYNTRCKVCANNRTQELRKARKQRVNFYESVDWTQEKRCPICGEYKPLTDFAKRLIERDGFRRECRVCNMKNLEEQIPGFGKGRPWRISRSSSINRISASPEEMDRLYIENPYCHYCKMPLKRHEVSIDHKDPLKGDFQNQAKTGIQNLVISCIDCNRLKHTRNEQEFRVFLIQYRNRLNALILEDQDQVGRPSTDAREKDPIFRLGEREIANRAHPPSQTTDPHPRQNTE